MDSSRQGERATTKSSASKQREERSWSGCGEHTGGVDALQKMGSRRQGERATTKSSASRQREERSWSGCGEHTGGVDARNPPLRDSIETPLLGPCHVLTWCYVYVHPFRACPSACPTEGFPHGFGFFFLPFARLENRGKRGLGLGFRVWFGLVWWAFLLTRV